MIERGTGREGGNDPEEREGVIDRKHDPGGGHPSG